ncbi:HlyD family efflux transporter periplasmic adaptor subunit [Methyloligella sp. 2.7D]|uniref:HlyD family secretion protein n=1 Tax=unclassified Methyloligella TaxID=2625955 RepID=UPI00157BC0C2|nr:HlyD family efflux transporter periplasmic adaptor subunit [Methyloligella sp. GL2]QKP76618.1 HlyD family efflux transporter periplasmic adaptor subunit [Methyloligella sp. GL2]
MHYLKRYWRALAVVAVIGAAGWVAWLYLWPSGLPDTIASGNGRIEATEIDIAAKIAGRVEDIYAHEGDFVTAGQPLAKMDTKVLEAELAEAQANSQRADISIKTAQELVTQRQAEQEAATAVVAQRQAELDIAQKNLDRSKELVAKEAVPVQRLDDDTSSFRAAQAALSAAKADLAAAQAAINSAKSEVIGAKADLDAADATIQRIKADIDDSTLTSPRDGRVQYRVAEPGEVLSAGGTVLNMVDLSDVYMTFFLPTLQAGRVGLDSEVHLVLDVAPEYVIPASVSYVADVAQFTPKSVETAEEREKLMFRIKATIAPELLKKYIQYVKTGLPGVAYVRLDPNAPWPDKLKVNLPSD